MKKNLSGIPENKDGEEAQSPTKMKKQESKKNKMKKRDSDYTFTEMERDTRSKVISRSWKAASKFTGDENAVTVKLLHWNILAQKLCDGFDKMDDASPMLYFDNRCRLMR